MSSSGQLPLHFGQIISSDLQVSSVRFYRLPTTFKLTSKEVDHVTTNSVWTCFAKAEAYDPEWTHFYFDASSSRCSLRGGLVSFDFTALSPMGTPGGEPRPLLRHFALAHAARLAWFIGFLTGSDGSLSGLSAAQETLFKDILHWVGYRFV